MIHFYVDSLLQAAQTGFDLSSVSASFWEGDGCLHSADSYECALPESAPLRSVTLLQVAQRSEIFCESCFSSALFQDCKLKTWVSKFDLVLSTHSKLKHAPSTVAEYLSLVEVDSLRSSVIFQEVLLPWAESLGVFLPGDVKAAMIRERLLPEVHRTVLAELLMKSSVLNRAGLESVSAAYDLFVNEHIEALIEQPGWVLVHDLTYAGKSPSPAGKMLRLAYSLNPGYGPGHELLLVPSFLLGCFPNCPVVSLEERPSDATLDAVLTLYAPSRPGPYSKLWAAYTAAQLV